MSGTELDFEALERNRNLLLRNLLPRSCVDGFHEAVRRSVEALGWSGSPDESIMDIFRSRKGLRQSLYNMLQNLVEVHECRTYMHHWFEREGFYRRAGFVAPAVWPGLRIDIPDESRFLLPFHQDYASTRSHRAWRAWIPLSQASATTGSMTIIPGTHHLGPLPHDAGDGRYPQIPAELLEGREEVLVEAEPGDVLLFHPLLVHGSVPNRSERIKWTLLLQIQDAAAPVDSDDPADRLAEFIRLHEARTRARGSA